MQQQKNYQVTVTSDVIRGRNNLGGSSDYFFSNVEDMKTFLSKRVFAGRTVTFTSGLAISETLSDTLVASICFNGKTLDAKDFI
jgi:hypothetical protein